MNQYKLVPVEMALPCPFCGSSNIGNKYIETYSTDSSYDTFGCKDCGARFEDGCQDDWNRRAAPAVQGEPVAYAVFADNGNIRIWCADPIQAKTLIQEYGDQVLPLYTAPQPVEQQPECGCCGQTDRCDDDCDAVVIGGHRAAEQQPAPDVAGLVEAAAAALDEIEKIMHEAYNSAYPVCCGRAGSECCGSPEPEWGEFDMKTMDRLSPHQAALTAALAPTAKGVIGHE